MTTKLHLLPLLLLLCVLAGCSASASPDEWHLSWIEEKCDTFNCFEGQVDRLAEASYSSMFLRIFYGEGVQVASIERIQEGRDYRINLYYTTFQELNKGRQDCVMTVWYDPDTLKIDHIEKSGVCSVKCED